MAGVLFGIPVVRWIKGTAKRMENAGRDDRASWNRAWGEEYIALGGQSASCGTKGCPRAAAYALWYLGYVRGTNRERLDWPIAKVYAELGKNGAYAVIALRLLQSGE